MLLKNIPKEIRSMLTVMKMEDLMEDFVKAQYKHISLYYLDRYLPKFLFKRLRRRLWIKEVTVKHMSPPSGNVYFKQVETKNKKIMPV
jgi:hypothetical protein